MRLLPTRAVSALLHGLKTLHVARAHTEQTGDRSRHNHTNIKDQLAIQNAWSRSYFGAAPQITHPFWLYRRDARPIGVYVLAAPPCGVHKRSIAARPMCP